MNQDTVYCRTPLGTVEIIGDDAGILSIHFYDKNIEPSVIIPVSLQKCVIQLDEYFQKKRKAFDLKLNPQGTDFQKQVWLELQEIPFGKTITYLDQSKRMENIKAIRAIASANGKNPIGIVIPCHRVIGSDGSLTGYAGGIWRKKWMLEHESPSKQTSLF